MWWLVDCWCPKENSSFSIWKLFLGFALADPSSKWLEILHTALSRSSWDLGSWSSVLHLFQHRCQVKLLCYRLHKGEKRATNFKKRFENGGLWIQPREKRITWASLGLKQTAVVGRLHICLEMTTPWLWDSPPLWARAGCRLQPTWGQQERCLYPWFEFHRKWRDRLTPGRRKRQFSF